MEKTWVVMCPNWADEIHVNKRSGWSLLKKEIKNIGTEIFEQKIICQVCGLKFSLHEGVREAFTSDIALQHFLYNSNERGAIDAEGGKSVRIKFVMPFEDVPTVQFTPTFHVQVAAGYVSPDAFTMLCNSVAGSQKKGVIGWSALGHRFEQNIPIWRTLLTSSKENQLRKNFRSEIVELEAAIEVFIGECFGKTFGAKLSQKTIEQMLNFSVEQQMKIAFREVRGKTLEQLCPKEYANWQKHVNTVRNDIVHRGLKPSKEQAKNARRSTFELLVKADNSALDAFQVNINQLQRIVFGIAKIKAGETSVTVTYR
jgi:hypothetical protein